MSTLTAVEKQLHSEPDHRRYTIVLMAILSGLMIWSVSDLSVALDERGMIIARNILTGLVNPDLAFLFSLTNQGVFYLLMETIAIAFLGTILGAFLAVPLAFLSASNIVPKPISGLTRMLLIVIRTIPSLVYGLMLIRVTGPGPFAGVLTIGITSIGMLAKLYVDAIEDLDIKVLESMTSMGCTVFEKIRFGILPQLFSLFLSVMIYRFDMNMREASILGLVGAGGIGAPLIFAMQGYRWSQVGSILIGLVVLILIIETVSNKLRTKLVNG
ncbi:phosphonate transport system permease protein [Pelagirhabdus alkalitolerans]|uniref:Phosphonate transport system permease protein n=1 Tax=Pelagirhabdus alkalitolerans TaxID=1612202 RepID=A0A1G6GNL1_9BACI|nr:phosphonate ABC transporter, permease protein PhnE [Pelagirhabdus alkalitolerans]SDB83538.1 phosphonate transport system permease protein [Pelagirhabdus alkalitolerans]